MTTLALLTLSLTAAPAPPAPVGGIGTACEVSVLRPAELEPFDAFGWSVDIQNNQAFVGCIGDDDVDQNSGAVYVFGRTPTGWVPAQKITAPDTALNNEFGNSISVSGNWLLVGAHKQFGGAVYVFEGEPSGWVQRQKLTSSNESMNFHFGHSVHLDGDTAFIGQMRDDWNGFETGSAFVFERQGTQFVEVANVRGSDSDTDDRFGRTTKVQGDTAVAGAHVHNAEGGAAYVFVRDDNGTPADPLDDAWPELQKLVPADNQIGDRFGRSIALDGDTLLIGASVAQTGGQAIGAVYVFERDDNGTVTPLDDAWNESAKIVPPDGADGDRFGIVAFLEGDTALIGADRNDELATNAGAIYLYERTHAGWVFQAKLFGSDQTGSDNLGYERAVAISQDNIIGAGWGNAVAGTIAGGAWVWKKPAVSYCTGKLNSQGCVPAISAGGSPSLTDPNPFAVTGTDELNFKNGLLFYSQQPRAVVPFLGGTLCMLPPLRRTTIQNSAGNPPPAQDCSGVFSFDFNAWIQGGNDPGIAEGSVLRAQYWGRDPGDPVDGASLTNAIELVVCP